MGGSSSKATLLLGMVYSISLVPVDCFSSSSLVLASVSGGATKKKLSTHHLQVMEARLPQRAL